MAVPTDVSGLAAWYDASDIATLFQDSAGATPVTANGDRVGKMNDKSGNGVHLIQASSTFRGYYDAISFGGGGIRFDGAQVLNNAAFALAQPNTVFLKFYKTRRYANDEMTTDEVIYGGLHSGSHNTFFMVNASRGTYQGALDDTHGGRIYAGGALHAPGQILTSVPHIVTMEFNTVSSTIRLNGAELVAATTIGGNSKSQLALGAYSNGTIPSKCLIAECIVYNRLLTAGERDSIEAYLLAKNGTAPNIVFDGDSHTRGYEGCSSFGDYVYQCISGLSTPVHWHNRAVPGQTAATMAGDAATDIDSRISATASVNILVVCAGANDLFGGTALATVQTTLADYVTARRTAGWDKIIVCSIPPRASSGTYTQANWGALADWIEAGSSGADYTVDIRDDTDIGEWGDNANATYYTVADQVHWTDAGALKFANLVRPQIEAAIAAASAPASAVRRRGALGMGLGLGK